MMNKHSSGNLSMYYSEILVSNKSLHFQKQSETNLSDSGQNVGLVMIVPFNVNREPELLKIIINKIIVSTLVE